MSTYLVSIHSACSLIFAKMQKHTGSNLRKTEQNTTANLGQPVDPPTLR